MLEVLLGRWKGIIRITINAIALLVETNVLTEDPVQFTASGGSPPLTDIVLKLLEAFYRLIDDCLRDLLVLLIKLIGVEGCLRIFIDKLPDILKGIPHQGTAKIEPPG